MHTLECESLGGKNPLEKLCSALQTNMCFCRVLLFILLLIKCVPCKICLGCTFGEQGTGINYSALLV